MKYLLNIFALLLLVFVSSPSFSQELKICEEGIGKCQPLVTDAQKYSKCMRLMCYEYYSEKDKKEKDISKFYFEYVGEQEANISKAPTGKMAEELARPCEYGVRKCDSLSSNPEYYWECMTDSCKTPHNEKPDCEEGRNQCFDQQKIFNDCMKLTCGDQAATFESCPAARSSCNESYRSYWNCVYKICLGPVDQYIKPASVKKFMIVKDRNGIKRRVQVNKAEPFIPGVPGWAAKAPQGVDPEEWVRDTPQKFMITGNPSEYMQCIIPTAMIDCPLRDIRSCRCSDGTIPIMLNGTPSPKYNEN